MSDVIRVKISLSEVGVRPESGEFEQRCLEVASAKVAGDVAKSDDSVVLPEVLLRHRVVDIDVEGDDVIVILGEKPASKVDIAGDNLADGHLSLVGDEDGRDTTCDVDVCECGNDYEAHIDGACGHDHTAEVEVVASAEAADIAIEDSAAWEGELQSVQFQVDVLDLCALLDLMGFAQQLSQATGAISPTIRRSLMKLEAMLAANIGEESENGGTKPSDAFLQHMNAWMTESTELFNQAVTANKRRIVRAEMMPGAGFDPSGGMNTQQGPPTPIQGPPSLHLR